MTDLDQRAGLMVAEDLYGLREDEYGYELVNGELRVRERPGLWHGTLASRLIVRLGGFVEAHGLGIVTTESGFVLRRSPDTVRGPDVAFVRVDRLPNAADLHRFFEGAPDLVAEVVSPNDTAWEIAEKRDGYVARGVRLLWIVYPKGERVEVWTPDQAARVLRVDDVLDGGDVVPGFRLPLAELFAPPPNASAPRA